MHIIFCYGTLREGESNHSVIEGAILKERTSWGSGELFDTGDGYPAYIQSDYGKVYGEIYKVGDKLLERIDILEGFQEGREGNLYERIIQPIETKRGNYEAITYVMQEAKPAFKRIPGGDWVSYRLNK
ncbi:gamma-glutamylcyclotransferase family protein [Pseudalkalibacillus hwajinpoensis]|uniref:gamma-glutamylcyclotransferase family protein n=1 Tax=Guptibacillus hwajinpoensis TaxID=208199 RepID=UPI00325AAA79